MKRKPTVTILAGYGINADAELETAFRSVGAGALRVHFRDLVENPERLERTDIVAFAGGFSFGDHLGSGLVLASRFRHALGTAFSAFLRRGGLVIGICNGFQILVKMGVLPNLDGAGIPEATLIHNESGRFVDRWVRVAFDPESPCVWTKGLEAMDLPIRHGEGRFVASDDLLDRLEAAHLAAVRYDGTNPNGSSRSIAGICDPTGRIFALMPHPEAYLTAENHPLWRRRADSARGRTTLPGMTPGVELLERGVREAAGG